MGYLNFKEGSNEPEYMPQDNKPDQEPIILYYRCTLCNKILEEDDIRNHMEDEHSDEIFDSVKDSLVLDESLHCEWDDEDFQDPEYEARYRFWNDLDGGLDVTLKEFVEEDIGERDKDK